MRPPTSLHENRIGGPQNFRPPVQNDLCNSIGTSATLPHGRVESELRRATDVGDDGRAMPARLLRQPDAARSLPYSTWNKSLRQYSASLMPAGTHRLPAALARADQVIKQRDSAAAIG